MSLAAILGVTVGGAAFCAWVIHWSWRQPLWRRRPKSQLELAREVQRIGRPGMPELQLAGYRPPRVWLRASLLIVLGIPVATGALCVLGWLAGALVRVCGGGR